jgi:hypothetical protein
MEFIKIYIFCFITSLSIFSYGYSLNKVLFKFDIKNIFEFFLLGVIFVSFIALFLNFFISLNIYINTFIFIISFFLLFLFKDSLDFIDIIKKISIISLIGFVTFLLDHSNRPDAGLYHLPYISMLNEEKIILGSVNLHYRFGHISSLQYLYSIFNNYILGDNGILIPLTIIFSVILMYFYEELKLQSENILKLFSMFSLLYILTAMNRYSGFGNDDPAHMFYLLSTYNILKFFVTKKKSQPLFNKIILYSVYTFLIKQFYVLILIFPFLLFITNFKKINLFNNSNIFTIFFIFFWLIKNIFVSSCLLYPVSFTCINSLEWSPTNTRWDAKKTSNESEAWAKAWPDRTDKSKDFTKYLSDYKWINDWMNSHVKTVKKKLTPILFFSILLIIYCYINFKSKKKIKKNIFLSYILFINLIFSIIWFFKFPMYRYGAAYLGSSIILINIILLHNLEIKENLKKTFIIVLALICFLVSAKNLNRIYENFDKKYVDYPWPKKNSFTEKNQINSNTPIIYKDEIIYYVSSPYPLCMYSKAPCTTFRNLNLKRKIYPGNYKVLMFEK